MPHIKKGGNVMASMKDCCCGVDVHKSFIVAVIAKLKGKDVIFTGYKRFSTFKKGLLEFKAWLGEHDCYEICMESTGKYYVPVYRTVEDETFHVDVVHPKYVKAPRGKKNDKKDAKRIADMYMRGKISLEKLIEHYQSQGYTITSKGLPLPASCDDSIAR
mgnify:CR=1 FL=1